MWMRTLVAGVGGYVYGLFDDDGITVGKVAVVSLVGAGVYYMVKKAGK